MLKLKARHKEVWNRPAPTGEEMEKAWRVVQSALREIKKLYHHRQLRRWELNQIESEMWKKALELEQKIQERKIQEVRDKAGIQFLKEQGLDVSTASLRPMKFRAPLSPPTGTAG